MSERVRVYHPGTDEPFDLPPAKAAKLRLEHGWRSHPIDPTAEPRVQTVEPDRGSEGADEALEPTDWRDDVDDTDDEEADAEPTPVPVKRSRRKPE